MSERSGDRTHNLRKIVGAEQIPDYKLSENIGAGRRSDHVFHRNCRIGADTGWEILFLISERSGSDFIEFSDKSGKSEIRCNSSADNFLIYIYVL